MTNLRPLILAALCIYSGYSAFGETLSNHPISNSDSLKITASRLFEEPLTSIGPSTPTENQALILALDQFQARQSNEETTALESFLKAHPGSGWNGSLYCNLGVVFYHTGYFSKALSAWEEAWKRSKNAMDVAGKALGDRSIGELAKMLARIGRYDRLDVLLKEIKGRDIRGPATEKIQGAKEGLWMMNEKPGEAFKCGPSALDRILVFSNPALGANPKILAAHSTRKGISLLNVFKLSKDIGMDFRIAKRMPHAQVLWPAVVHWKVGHYAAIVAKDGNRLHLQDPTFGGDIWISEKTLDEEGSGYFLIPKGPLPKGWNPVDEAEATGIWGKGFTSSSDGNASKPGDDKSGGDGCPPTAKGMPTYAFHSMLISLNITDVPLGYSPPRGPNVNLRLTYNQREANQPATFSYTNLGNKWTLDWTSYLTDDPTNLAANVNLFVQGGGTEINSGYSSSTASYAPQMESQAVLVRITTSPIKYERRMPDGSKEVYSVANGATSFPRKVFLSQIVDAQGQTLTLAYDASLRLTTLTDALAQVTTLTYGVTADPLKVTKVTDPFGRTAILAYNAQSQLQSITDEAGLISQFTYGQSDFISSMTTPYGTTSFIGGDGPNGLRWLQATDPLGQKERIEFRHSNNFIVDEVPLPTGILTTSTLYHEPSTAYWDKKAMELGGGDINTAVVYHWLRSENLSVSSGTLASIKNPLETRTWINYGGQTSGITIQTGTHTLPAAVGRVLDDGTTQVESYEYNSLGKMTKATDELNRITQYTYASNNMDLLTVSQVNGGSTELLFTYTYNTLHLPLTIKDPAGQTTTYTYNSNGQMLSESNAKGEKTTFSYNANGYMIKSFGPVVNDTTFYAYDTFGRLSTVTLPDGFATTTVYDNLDRPTKVTYPDATFEQFVYDKLDLGQTRDRLGRWTKRFFNANRRLTAVQDPLGRTTNFEWCGCGSLSTMTDPNGNNTTWKRDVQGRLTEKQYADGKKTVYAYESKTSRLKSITDAKGQASNFTYFIDNNLLQVAYTGAAVATAAVSYTYDAIYDRLTKMTDGTGVTNYAYNPITTTPTLGAGRLVNIDGPLSNDVVAFQYDALGRETTRSINAVNATFTYDNLGRTTSEANALGTFTYKYVGVTGRLDSLIYPNGQKNKYAYFTKTGDFRLSQIKDLNPAMAVLSQFDYTYDVVGQVKTWTQKAGTATASIHNFSYDAVDQILGDEVTSAATGNPELNAYAYTYDLMGNRLSAQENGFITSTAYNTLNQATAKTAGGKARFLGSLNEAGTVTVDGKAASVSSANNFDGMAAISTGIDTVTVTAKDYSNNTTTKKYQVTTSGTTGTITYDNNGNMVADGTRSFEWDAVDRLTAIVNGALRSEFTYDGLSRRVRIVEKNGAAVTGDKRLLWAGNAIAEERDAIGSTVAKRYFNYGVQVGATKYFYTRDHLGSIKEMTDNTGAIVAQYAYDPYGTRTRVAGTLDADFGFTGHYLHSASGLYLSLYRAYSSGLGIWISRDPIGEEDGLNLYSYVQNDPVNYWDPDGTLGVALKCLPAMMKAAAKRGAKNAGKGKPPSVAPKPSAPKPPKSKSKPPEPDPEAKGNPHTVVEKPGSKGQYTTHNSDGTYTQYRGSGKDHGEVPRPNVKENSVNTNPNTGQNFPGKPAVRPARPDEIPGGGH